MEAAITTEPGAAAARPNTPERSAAATKAPPLVRHRIPVALLATPLALLALLAYRRLDEAMVAAIMATVLVLVAATDLERRIIPNVVVLPATAIVLLAHISISPARTPEWLLAAAGAAAVFVLPNLINRSAMGMGDVKLAAFLGAGLGWGVIGAVLLAFLSVFPLALGTLIRGGLAAGKSTLPFGPFLAFGGLLILIVPRLIGLGG